MSASGAMQVSDSNGEISASVEETNRVRASLGLAPLAEGGGGAVRSKEDEARQNGQQRAADMAKEEKEDALRDKLEGARRQRLLHQKLSGKSLGEQLAGEEMDSAAAWVGKHQTQEVTREERRKELRKERKRGGAKGEAAAKMASMASRYDDEDAMGMGMAFGEEEGGGQSSSLAGAVVGHGAADFKAGESVVLTLADQTVLGEGEGGTYALNEDEEMLENVNMAEQYKRDKVKAEARGDGYKYNPYEGSDGMALLGKYDEAAARTTMTLDASGSVDEAKQKKLAAIKARLAATQAGATGMAHDLSAVGAVAPTFADGKDFMTREEAGLNAAPATFRKSSKDKGEKKKKLRKKVKPEGLDLDAMAAAEAAAGGGNDHASAASRADRMRERNNATIDQVAERREAFGRALATAEVRSKAMEDEHIAKRMEVDAQPPAPVENEVEVDAELYAALARARRLTAQKPVAEHEDVAAQRIADNVASRNAAERAAEREGDGVELSSLEFSETGEFCKTVRAKDDVDSSGDLPSVRFRETLRQREEGTAGTQSRAAGPSGGSVKVEAGEGDADKEDERERDNDDDDEEEEEETGNGADFMHEKKASGGLAAVLDIARNRGMLGADEEKAGRMFDQKGAGLHSYTEAEVDKDDRSTKGPSFVLEHYDEYGRAMTAKQAFRQLSWKFHGKAPSKKNREKRMLEVEKQLADKTEDKAMSYMHALQAAQASTKSAHVVLTGIHAIKPSEIKSVRHAAGEGGDGHKKKKAKAGI